MQRELLCGVPDPVVGARLAEVIARRRSRGPLRVDDGEEGVGRTVDDGGGEGVLEHHHAGSVGQRPNQFGLQRPPVSAADRGRRVHEHIASDLTGERIVRGIGVAQDVRAEVVESAIGLVDPRLVCRGHRCGHDS